MDSDPLLRRSAIIFGAVDYRGHPISRSSFGGWTSALFIIGVEIAERFAFYGISLNLISYLIGPLGESTAASAAAINTWSGVASLLPLLGAFVADSYLDRFCTIVIASHGLPSGPLLPPSLLRPPLPDAQNCLADPPEPFARPYFMLWFDLRVASLAQQSFKARSGAPQRQCMLSIAPSCFSGRPPRDSQTFRPLDLALLLSFPLYTPPPPRFVDPLTSPCVLDLPLCFPRRCPRGLHHPGPPLAKGKGRSSLFLDDIQL